MPEAPEIDVVIPVRDGARYLPQCLDSVMAQTRPVRSAVAVDDGSIDATPEILADYQRRWRALEVVRTDRRGLPHARNAGIARCRAAFIAFLDSDDIWASEKLERQLGLLAGRGQVGFVYCGYRHIDENGRPLQRRSTAPRLRGNVLCDLLLGGNLISGSGSAVVARRSLLERVGGFDESLSFAEDWDLWLRLAELSQVDFVAEPLVAIRVHGESMQHRETRHILESIPDRSAGIRMHAQSIQRPRIARQEEFLFGRLRVVEKWIDRVPDSRRILTRYRIEAVRVAIKNVVLRFPPRWGLRSRLRASDVLLARRLFPTRRAYAIAFVCAVAEVCTDALRGTPQKLMQLRRTSFLRGDRMA